MNQEGKTYERPWCTYRTVEQRGNYQIKHIVVFPHKRLSLQYHNHREEHWTVIKGEGIATVGEDDILMKVNKSVYIPLQKIHRMTNETSENVEFLEIQIGDYLGEDDIVRLEDDFGRC